MANVNMKVVSMVLLILFTSAQVITLKYAQSIKPYKSVTAVMMGELMKLVFSFMLICSEQGSIKKGVYVVTRTLQKSRDQIARTSVPAILYTIQNNFMYLAVDNLEAAVFQVCSQLKLLTAALFSVTFLHKRLSLMQWISLLILSTGIIFINYDNSTSKSKSEHANFFLGMISVVICSLTSGFAGVYTEKMVKDKRFSIWLNNFWLAFWSLIMGLLMLAVRDPSSLKYENFFDGYTVWSWLAIFLLAIGGLIIAMVLKYADNILKAFGGSISIILSSLASVYLFDFKITFYFIVGCLLVIVATLMYNYGAMPPKQYKSLPQEEPVLLKL